MTEKWCCYAEWIRNLLLLGGVYGRDWKMCGRLGAQKRKVDDYMQEDGACTARCTEGGPKCKALVAV